MYYQPEYSNLLKLAQDFDQPEYHLKYLMKQEHRFNNFSIGTRELFFDFSRQRVNNEVMNSLYSLAQNTYTLDTFGKMARGEKVNTTENRAAFHTGARLENNGSVDKDSLSTDARNLLGRMNQVQEQICQFSRDVHAGKLCGTTKKVFDTAVVVGIGGSYLGCEFVCPMWTLTILARLQGKSILKPVCGL